MKKIVLTISFLSLMSQNVRAATCIELFQQFQDYETTVVGLLNNESEYQIQAVENIQVDSTSVSFQDIELTNKSLNRPTHGFLHIDQNDILNQSTFDSARVYTNKVACKKIDSTSFTIISSNQSNAKLNLALKVSINNQEETSVLKTTSHSTYPYNVIDEVTITAPTRKIFQATIDFYDGRGTWLAPDLSSRVVYGNSCARVGSICEVTINDIIQVKFHAKIVEIIPNQMIRMDYIDGAFIGQGVWRFQTIGNKTRTTFHWQARPNGFMMNAAALFWDVEKKHSQVMQRGFAKLKRIFENN